MYVRASISAVRNNESKDEKRRRGGKSETNEEINVSRRRHGTAIFQARRPPTRGERARQ